MWELRRLGTLWASTACYRMALPFGSGRSYCNQGTLQTELFARMLYKMSSFVCSRMCLHTCIHTSGPIKCLHLCIGISVYKGRVASSGIMFIPDFVKHCLWADMDPNGLSNAKACFVKERRLNCCVSVDYDSNMRCCHQCSSPHSGRPLFHLSS
jgi:hypothetical protein